MDKYYWVKGSCLAEEFELASYQLFEFGVSSVEELESSTAEKTEFKISDSDSSLIENLLKKFPQWLQESGEEENQNWDAYWREQQKPIPVTEDLTVYPSWIEIQEDGKTSIILDPKMAFGTGSHESTQLISELIGSLFKDKLGLESLIDLGTGTGILSIYAQKISGITPFITEIDPVTVPCIIENFEINGLPVPMGMLGFLDALKSKEMFDVMLCNMIRTELWPMREDMLRLLKQGGYLLISGQLLAEKHFITDWFTENQIDVVEERSAGEWWAVTGVKK